MKSCDRRGIPFASKKCECGAEVSIENCDECSIEILKKKCDRCGEMFLPCRKRQRFCSMRCGNRFRVDAYQKRKKLLKR